jgi:hypothetical protein
VWRYRVRQHTLLLIKNEKARKKIGTLYIWVKNSDCREKVPMVPLLGPMACQRHGILYMLATLEWWCGAALRNDLGGMNGF